MSSEKHLSLLSRYGKYIPALPNSGKDIAQAVGSLGSSSSASSSKRSNANHWADSSGIPAKVGKTVGEVEPVQQATDLLQDASMTLTGTGKEQASGGASSDGQGKSYYIEKPLSAFGSKVSTYKKVHKFMTFGIANTTLAAPIDTTPASTGYFMSTYLAELPWHIPAFYLTPSEFNLLPIGAHVLEVSVDVYYRGSTIQFETAASTTGLATLNQINDIAVANGLNRSGQGSNVRYTGFDAAPQTMLPTGITRPVYGPVAGIYRGMVRDYYGSDTGDGTFQGDIPKHHVGRQTFLYNYWAMTSRTGVPPLQAIGGWPCLADKIKQMDGKTVVNTCVASSTYKPKQAPLKEPLRTYNHGLPAVATGSTIQVPVMGNLVNVRNANIAAAAGAIASGGLQTTNTEGTPAQGTDVDEVNLLNIYSPIEKSQFVKSGYWGQPDCHIQPSVHIGVQPVPALSTSATLTEDAQFNAWTDTRAYWEVVATMVVKEHNPTAYPYAPTANVPFGENMVWSASIPDVNFNPRNDGATFCGLYTTNAALAPTIADS